MKLTKTEYLATLKYYNDLRKFANDSIDSVMPILYEAKDCRDYIDVVASALRRILRDNYCFDTTKDAGKDVLGAVLMAPPLNILVAMKGLHFTEDDYSTIRNNLKDLMEHSRNVIITNLDDAIAKVHAATVVEDTL